eukprot:284805-Rhodomonas_salina.2
MMTTTMRVLVGAGDHDADKGFATRPISLFPARSAIDPMFHQLQAPSSRIDSSPFAWMQVVWGKFMPLAELEAMMAKESFVPGGKKAWEETVKRDLHTKYLK